MLYPENEEQYQALFTSDDPTGRRRRKVIDDPYLHRIQQKHFLIFDVLPFFGTLVAIALLFVHPIGWAEMSIAFVMWVLTGLGISVGYHRLFAHASFTTPFVTAFLAIFGGMAGQGGVISWVAMHRIHHKFSDHEGDVHSPNLSGAVWWANCEASPIRILRGWRPIPIPMSRTMYRISCATGP